MKASTTPRSTEQAQRARPSTIDEVNVLLDQLDYDARADGIMPSELARIRDTKTKALALRARLEDRDALFEPEAVRRHPSWRRLREAILEELCPHPDIARRLAERIEELGL